LEDPQLPDYEHWYSGLKGYNVLDHDYDTYQKCLAKGSHTPEQALKALGLTETPKPGAEVLEELRDFFTRQGFTTFRDFVRYYLRLDVEPLVKACEKTSEIFHDEYSINIYRCYQSLPSVAIEVAMRYMEETELYIPDERIYELLQKTPGGQSLIFTMEAIKDITRIRSGEYGEDAQLVKSIFSLDATLMYGYGMESAPCGKEIVRDVEDGFVARYSNKKHEHDKTANMILDFIAWDRNGRMRKEKRSGTGEREWRVDGVLIVEGKPRKGVEIFGDAAHNCPIHVHRAEEIHPITKLTYGDLEKHDRKRLKSLRKYEFDGEPLEVVYMCEWLRDYAKVDGVHHEKYLKFLELRPDYKLEKGRLTEEELLEKIREKEIRGFIKATFETPPELQKFYDQFPVIFRKADLERHHAGPMMEEVLKKMKLHKRPTNELISCHNGEQIFVSTSLARYYMKLGLKVSNVTLVAQYTFTKALRPFVKRASDMRMRATTNHEKLLGNLAKSLVVSTYGRTILNPNHFTQTKVVNANKLIKHAYGGNFMYCEYVGKVNGGKQDIFEVKKRPKNLHFKTPIQIAASILNNSKELMLRLVYDVIVPHFCPRTFTFFTSMTDSLSIICAYDTLEEWFQNGVIPEKRDDFERIKYRYFVNPQKERSKFKAGIFKKEWQGTTVYGVTAKCYAVCHNDEIVKLSARGIPYVPGKKLTPEDFRNVLRKHKPITVEFSGFTYVYGEMLMEKMRKCAVSPVYLKRRVLNDFTTTTLLDV
jgi:hypothetical protein